MIKYKIYQSKNGLPFVNNENYYNEQIEIAVPYKLLTL
jgi:hypothetical protein